jgi:hypothetical protein
MANKLDELQIAKGSDYLKLWLRARLAEREGNLTAAVGTYEQAIAELDKMVGVANFKIDARFRLAVLRSAAPDRKSRDAFKGVRLARSLVEELDDCPARKMALLVLACAHAEKGDFEDAIAAVDEVSNGSDVWPSETARCKKLKELFQDKSPYRLQLGDPAGNLLEMPDIACYFGPMKKIPAAPESTLTIPDE